jgi:single-strand DNA-binding protein
VNDTIVTVVGNVVDSPRRSTFDSGTVTNFRMASTARRYDSSSQQFVDSGTFWVDVECWSGLSGNVAASVSKGDAVIVHGALSTHSWESDNGPRSKPRIKAFAVGHNLNRGTAVFKRDRPAPAVRQDSASTVDGHEIPPSVADLVAGRDYVGAGGTLDGVNPADLSAEPAHV